MAAMKREVGTATGRGVDANGLLGRIAAFATRSIAAGGAGWFMHDNMLADLTSPGIVITNVNNPGPNDNAKILRIYFNVANASCILFEPQYYWNPSTHVGRAWTRRQIYTLDSGQFNYWLFGGPELFGIIAKVGSYDPTPCFMDEWVGDDELTQPEANGSSLAEDVYLESGDTQNQVSGYWNLQGASTWVDANGNLRFATVVSGANMRIDVYGGPALDVLIAQSTNTSGLGSLALTAVGGSGISGTLNADLIASTTSNASIYCRYNRVRVQTGHGANFTVGYTYFMTDFQDYSTRISYGKVTAISGDVLTLDYIRPGLQFKSGGWITPYRARYYVYGYRAWDNTALTPNTANVSSQMDMALPYLSRRGHEFQASLPTNGSTDGQVGTYYTSFIGRGGGRLDRDPQPYKGAQPLLGEFNGFNGGGETDMTEGRGHPKNLVIKPDWGGAVLGDSVTVGTIEYVIIFKSSYSWCFRYSESDV